MDQHSDECRSWRESSPMVLVVLAVVVVALVATTVLRPESRTIHDTARTIAMITAPLCLVAGFLVYFLWRLTGRVVTGWLTVALVVSGVVGTAQATLVLTPGTKDVVGPLWAPLLQLALGLSLCWIIGGAQRRALRGDPALVGLAGGLTLTGLLVLAAVVVGPLAVPGAVVLLLDAAIALTTLGLASALLALSVLDPWARRRLVLVVALLGAGQTVQHFPHAAAGLDVVVIVVDVIGAVLLCTTALELLRISVGDAQVTLDTLADQLAGAEAEARLERARMHEIGSTLAGIASASQVIRDGAGISFRRRHLLEEMMEAELARLGRLVSGLDPLGPRSFDVDDVLRPLVVAQQARGRSIWWLPGGHRAVGLPDELSEVVHVLLENAARHGGSGPVQLVVLEHDAVVEVVVSDVGPGVAPELTGRLFDWGVRSTASVGQGIGLHIARNLMSKNAGSLELVTSTAAGAAFVARLPSARPPSARPPCEVHAHTA